MNRPHAPIFRVGAAVSDTFRAIKVAAAPIALIALVLVAFSTAVTYLLLGPDFEAVAMNPENQSEFADRIFSGEFFVVQLLSFAAYAIGSGAMVWAVFEAGHGRPAPVGAAFGAALSSALPLIILYFAWVILVSAGAMLLVVPGLWLIAAMSPLLPLIVIERRGFSALGGAFALSKGARWPILGTFIVLMVIMIVISVVAEILLGLLFAIAPLGAIVSAFFHNLLVIGLSYAIISAGIVAIYMQLRGEAAPMRDVAEVF